MIWLMILLCLQADKSGPADRPAITQSRVIIVRADPKLSILNFTASLQVDEDLLKVVPLEKFIDQNLFFQEEIIQPDIKVVTVTLKNHFTNPITGKLELTHFIGSITKNNQQRLQILARKGKFIVNQEHSLVGLRIGLTSELASQIYVVNSLSTNQQVGWAIEREQPGGGDHALFILNDSSVIWLKTTLDGFDVHFQKDDKNILELGPKITSGNDLVIYRYIITCIESPSPRNNYQKISTR